MASSYVDEGKSLNQEAIHPARQEAENKSIVVEGSRQGHLFGFALYLARSRDARPLPRGLTGHAAHPLRSILHRALLCAAVPLANPFAVPLVQERPCRLVIGHLLPRRARAQLRMFSRAGGATDRVESQMCRHDPLAAEQELSD
jgi:hypothetical protein